MRLFNQRLLLAALLCLPLTANAQNVHTITLNVDTQTIQNPNLADFCNFGQTDGSSNEDFTIFVNVGDTVRWVGVSSTAPDTDQVELSSINHEGGPKLFGRNRLKDTEGVIVGVVTEGATGDEEKYKISFRVFNNGVKRNGTFNIDPKIKVK